MQRLQTLGTLLAQTPLQGECQVELALASPHGQVSCPSANDANLVRSVLNDFLPPRKSLPPRPPTESICLHLIQGTPLTAACQPTTLLVDKRPQGPFALYMTRMSDQGHCTIPSITEGLVLEGVGSAPIAFFGLTSTSEAGGQARRRHSTDSSWMPPSSSPCPGAFHAPSI